MVIGRIVSSAVVLGAIVCSAAVALGQAGAPTQRAHIPGIPNGTSIYAGSIEQGKDFFSVGCVSKVGNGDFRISDWRGAAKVSVAGAPPSAAIEPLVLRLQGDQDMFNFQVGHEVEVSGVIAEQGTNSLPAKIKVESMLYLSRTCWQRGTTTEVAATPKP